MRRCEKQLTDRNGCFLQLKKCKLKYHVHGNQIEFLSAMFLIYCKFRLELILGIIGISGGYFSARNEKVAPFSERIKEQ